MKIPCTPDCPRRTPTCHGSCPDYAKYAEWRERVRQKRLHEVSVTGALIDGANRRNPPGKKKDPNKVWRDL